MSILCGAVVVCTNQSAQYIGNETEIQTIEGSSPIKERPRKGFRFRFALFPLRAHLIDDVDTIWRKVHETILFHAESTAIL